MAPSDLSKRYCTGFYDDCDSSYWGSEGYYVRYAIVAAVLAIIVLFIIFSYLHAQRRIKKGLQPLAYHRWLVRRRGAHATQSPYVYYSPPQQVGQQTTAYPMNAYYGPAPAQPPQQPWAPPPPAYGQWEQDIPPTYAPPVGASKANANQNVDEYSRPNGEGSAGLSAPQPAHQAPTVRNEATQ